MKCVSELRHLVSDCPRPTSDESERGRSVRGREAAWSGVIVLPVQKINPALEDWPNAQLSLARDCLYCFTNSTRRLRARPASVLLSATGLVSPMPTAVRREAAMHSFTSHATTAAARS